MVDYQIYQGKDGEVTQCMMCGLEIKRIAHYAAWISNWDDMELDNYEVEDEPWFNACPGSRQMLETFPVFGKWYTHFSHPVDVKDHIPMDPLVRLVVNNNG